MKLLLRIHSERKRFFRSTNKVATITYQPSTAAATGCAKPSIGFIFCQSIRDHYKLSMFLFSTVVVLCLITPAAIIISAKNHSDGPATSSTTTSSSPSAPTQKHHILRRGLWGARSPLNPLQPLRPPLAVLIVTETGTATCGDLSKCFGAMQNLQNSHVGIEHLPDIRYNFVVGGDGNVYEGRGWLVQNERKDNSVEVAFMGEFSEQPLEQFMALTGPWLIEQGVKGGYLRNDVKVGCANRTGGFLCGEASLWAVKGNGGGGRTSH
ncbi:peptidoglycan-recognition protein SC2-like [Euwallacea similis]|uniref:peptidoglycan-recognition protein SC2-like n=1 Tax=Euwallacea similis TaxID=1736056 RepID=UPI00344F5BBA